MSQNKTIIGNLNISGDSVYTVDNLKEIFKNLSELNSSEISQKDIVEVLNKIIEVFREGTGEVIQ